MKRIEKRHDGSMGEEWWVEIDDNGERRVLWDYNGEGSQLFSKSYSPPRVWFEVAAEEKDDGEEIEFSKEDFDLLSEIFGKNIVDDFINDDCSIGNDYLIDKLADKLANKLIEKIAKRSRHDF